MARAIETWQATAYPEPPPSARLVGSGTTPADVGWWRYYDRGARLTYLVLGSVDGYEVRVYRGNVALPCCREDGVR